MLVDEQCPGWGCLAWESFRHTDFSEAALPVFIYCSNCQLDLLKAKAVFCGVAPGQTGATLLGCTDGKRQKKMIQFIGAVLTSHHKTDCPQKAQGLLPEESGQSSMTSAGIESKLVRNHGNFYLKVVLLKICM